MQHFLVYEMVVVVRYFPLCKPIIVPVPILFFTETVFISYGFQQCFIAIFN